MSAIVIVIEIGSIGFLAEVEVDGHPRSITDKSVFEAFEHNHRGRQALVSVWQNESIVADNAVMTLPIRLD